MVDKIRILINIFGNEELRGRLGATDSEVEEEGMHFLKTLATYISQSLCYFIYLFLMKNEFLIENVFLMKNEEKGTILQ